MHAVDPEELWQGYGEGEPYYERYSAKVEGALDTSRLPGSDGSYRVRIVNGGAVDINSIPEELHADLKRLLFDILHIVTRHNCPNECFTSILMLLNNKQVPSTFRCVCACLHLQESPKRYGLARSLIAHFAGNISPPHIMGHLCCCKRCTISQISWPTMSALGVRGCTGDDYERALLFDCNLP